MIRQLLTAVAITLFTVSSFLWSPSAIAATQSATQDYSASKQESQSYPSQAEYDKKQAASDYSYTDKSYADKQVDQSQIQKKQSNQTAANKKQYAQQEQSYQKK